MSSIRNKSYKSILMEVCAKRQVRPEFSHLMINLQPPMFKCTLRIPKHEDWEELKSEGKAGTKKESEHEAAKAMLPKVLSDSELINLRLTDGSPSSSNNSGVRFTNDKAEYDENPVSDTDNDELQQFPGAPLTDLITLCLYNKLNDPVFSESHQIGPNNTNIFTMTCSVGETSSKLARRLRKQDAKTMAAFRVYRDLRQKGYIIETKRSKKANRALLVPDSDMKNEPSRPMPLVRSRFVKPQAEEADQSKPEKEKTEEELKIESNAESYGGLLNYLTETAKDINIILNFKKPFKVQDADGPSYWTFVTLTFERNFDHINTNHLTLDGIGSTVEESRNSAAMCALKMLAEEHFIKL